ncbi:MAG: discoidin domain-containing protein, partial [Hymenobacter sp.]
MQNLLRLRLACFVILVLAFASPVLAQNLALNKTATASSTNGSNSASMATDGDQGTRWESASSDVQSIVVDLGSLQKVDRIRLYWETACGKDFTLAVSADNATWKTVVTVQGNASTTNEYSHLAPSSNDALATVRYIRMAGSARATQYGYSLYEFEVYGYSASDNLALGRAVTVSTSQSGFPATQAVDDNGNTRWGSEYDATITPIAPDSNYLYVDLRGIANITQVGLYWESAYASDFKLEVSNDAKTWKGIKRVTGNTQKTNIMAVSASGRYLRMHGLKRATQYGYSLWEFAVYETGGTPPPTNTDLAR